MHVGFAFGVRRFQPDKTEMVFLRIEMQYRFIPQCCVKDSSENPFYDEAIAES